MSDYEHVLYTCTCDQHPLTWSAWRAHITACPRPCAAVASMSTLQAGHARVASLWRLLCQCRVQCMHSADEAKDALLEALHAHVLAAEAAGRLHSLGPAPPELPELDFLDMVVQCRKAALRRGCAPVVHQERRVFTRTFQVLASLQRWDADGAGGSVTPAGRPDKTASAGRAGRC